MAVLVAAVPTLGAGPCANEEPTPVCKTVVYDIEPGASGVPVGDPCAADVRSRISDPDALQLFLPWFLRQETGGTTNVLIFAELDAPVRAADQSPMSVRVPYERDGLGQGTLVFNIRGGSDRRNLTLNPGPGVVATLRTGTGARTLRCAQDALDQCALSAEHGQEITISSEAVDGGTCSWSGNCVAPGSNAPCLAVVPMDEHKVCGVAYDVADGEALLVLPSPEGEWVKVEEQVGENWQARTRCSTQGSCSLAAPGRVRISVVADQTPPREWVGENCARAEYPLVLSLRAGQTYTCRPVFPGGPPETITLSLRVVTELTSSLLAVEVEEPQAAQLRCAPGGLCQTKVEKGKTIKMRADFGDRNDLRASWLCDGQTSDGRIKEIFAGSDVNCTATIERDAYCSGTPVPNFEFLGPDLQPLPIDGVTNVPRFDVATTVTLDASATNEMASGAFYRWEVSLDGGATVSEMLTGRVARWQTNVGPGTMVTFTLTVENDCEPEPAIATLQREAIAGF